MSHSKTARIDNADQASFEKFLTDSKSNSELEKIEIVYDSDSTFVYEALSNNTFPSSLKSLSLQLPKILSSIDVSSDISRSFRNLNSLEELNLQLPSSLYISNIIEGLPTNMKNLKTFRLKFVNLNGLDEHLYFNVLAYWLLEFSNLENLEIYSEIIDFTYSSFLKQHTWSSKLKTLKIGHDQTQQTDNKLHDLGAIFPILLQPSLEKLDFAFNFERFNDKSLNLLNEHLKKCSSLNSVNFIIAIETLNQESVQLVLDLIDIISKVGDKKLVINFLRSVKKNVVEKVRSLTEKEGVEQYEFLKIVYPF